MPLCLLLTSSSSYIQHKMHSAHRNPLLLTTIVSSDHQPRQHFSYNAPHLDYRKDATIPKDIAQACTTIDRACAGSGHRDQRLFICLPSLFYTPHAYATLTQDFLNETESKQFASYILAAPLVPSPAGKPPKGHAVRTHARCSLSDPAFADVLWNLSGLQEALGQWKGARGGPPKGLSSNIRLYCYEHPQLFGPREYIFE